MVGAWDLEAHRAAMFSGNSTGPFSNHAGIHRTFASREKWLYWPATTSGSILSLRAIPAGTHEMDRFLSLEHCWRENVVASKRIAPNLVRYIMIAVCEDVRSSSSQPAQGPVRDLRRNIKKISHCGTESHSHLRPIDGIARAFG